MDSAAPLAARRATAESGALCSRGTMTPWAPAASALRRQAPRLCGSCTPSSTSSSGIGGKWARKDSRSCSFCIGVSRRRATTPWCFTPSARRSRAARGDLWTFTCAARAASSTAAMRLSPRASLTQISSTRSGLDFSAASTTCTPQTCCSSMSAPAFPRTLSGRLAVAFRFRTTLGGLAGFGARHPGQFEINLGFVQVHAHHAHAHLVAEAVDLARALAHQAMMRRVEVIVIIAQRRDMHQAVHVDLDQLYENPEIGDTADITVEFLADLVHHELGLEPAHHLARGLVGAAFGQRTVLALLLGQLHRDLLVAVHQQVRVAAYRRGEMAVVRITQRKVADVVRAVYRL